MSDHQTIEQAVRAGISIGREQMRDKAVAFICDWAEELCRADRPVPGNALHDVAGEIEQWDRA